MTWRAALAAVVVIGSAPLHALESDRVAVEVLAGESPSEAALAYERACWRMGVVVSSARAVQSFAFQGKPFTRLVVRGEVYSRQCLGALEPGRLGVDGYLRWFDGFEGGALVPSERAERVPDELWYAPEAAPETSEPDPAIVSALERGESDALRRLGHELNSGLVVVTSLAARATPGTLAALEKIAGMHPHWRVRREAAILLDPVVSFARIAELAQNDAAWEVRHAAVMQLGVAAASPLALTLPRGDDATRLLLGRVLQDKAWEVRRTAITRLSSPAVASARGDLLRVAREDHSPHVRAASLEALSGAGVLSRQAARLAMKDEDETVAAVAARALAAQMTRNDAPVLWEAMNSPSRAVRLGSAALLDRVDDATVSPFLWPLYEQEADEVDADSEYLNAILSALGRHPYPGLAPLVRRRLESRLSPPETRYLARAFARIDPAGAQELLASWLDEPDTLRRSVAADALPDTPQSRSRRLELLEDPEPDVRAAAVLGLCRFPITPELARIRSTDLEPEGLGHAALRALVSCGRAPQEPVLMRTALASAADSSGAGLPALLACLLLLFSVVTAKVSAPLAAARHHGQ